MAIKILEVPGLTEAERDSISVAPNGALIYNKDAMAYDFTVDGASTWNRIADSLNSSPRNVVYVSSSDGNDATATGRISSPFQKLETALGSILDSSADNPYIINLSPGTYNENKLRFKPWVYIYGNDAAQLTVDSQVELDDSFSGSGGECGLFNISQFTPSAGFYTNFNVVGDRAAIIISNVFSNVDFIYNIEGSPTFPCNVIFNNVLKDTLSSNYPSLNVNVSSLEVYNCEFFNLSSLLTLTSDDRTAKVKNLTCVNQIVFSNDNDVSGIYNVIVNDTTCPDVVFATNSSGEIDSFLNNCNFPSFNFNQSGGPINVNLGVFVGNLNNIVGSATVTYTAPMYVSSLLSTGNITIDTPADLSLNSDGGTLQMTQSLTGTFEEGVTINNNNNGIDLTTANGSFNVEATNGTLLLTGSSGMTMKIDNGQWNMDMTVSGNPSTWLMSSDFNMNFPYGGGTFNVTTPDDINLTSSAGSVNVLANSGTITLGSPSTALVTMPVQTIVVGDYVNAGTSSVAVSGAIVSINTAGSPTLVLDGGPESTLLGGTDTTIQGNNTLTLTSASGDVVVTPSNALQLTTGGNVNISAGTDIVVNATSGSIGFNSGGLGFFGEAPVAQSAPIADASILLADVVTKFNTLLAYLRSRGDIDT